VTTFFTLGRLMPFACAINNESDAVVSECTMEQMGGFLLLAGFVVLVIVAIERVKQTILSTGGG
jgi:hypothetical protein